MAKRDGCQPRRRQPEPTFDWFECVWCGEDGYRVGQELPHAPAVLIGSRVHMPCEVCRGRGEQRGRRGESVPWVCVEQVTELELDPS